MDFADPKKMLNNMMIKPCPMAYRCFHNSIMEDLQVIVDDNRSRRTSVQQAVVDIATLQLFMMYAVQLTHLIN